jgi:hypothetical protein
VTFERAIHLPSPRRQKFFVAFHLTDYSYSFERRFEWVTWHFGFVWGRLFSDGGHAKWWDVRLPRRVRHKSSPTQPKDTP